MKKIFLFLAMILMLVKGIQAEDEIYGVWNASTSTVKLYYDDQRVVREGKSDWWEWSVMRTAKTVDLDVSMRSARPTSTMRWFQGFTQLTSIQHLDYLNTSSVRSMYAMFERCKELSSIDLRFFNTANVEDLSYMFSYCESLTSLDLTMFSLVSAKTVRQMFYHCSNLTTIYTVTSWSSSSAESLAMFYGCTKLKGGKGTKCNGTSNVDISYACPDQLVSDQLGLYGHKGYFTWSSYEYAVLDESGTTLTLYYDDQLPSKKNGRMRWWLYDAYSNATKVVLDASIQKARPISTAKWFEDFKQLTTIVNLDYLNTSEVRDMSKMFSGCEQLSSLVLPSRFNTSNVLTMSKMFMNCKGLQTISFSSTFSTVQVQNMSSMFEGCASLPSLSLSRFNTSKVTDMSHLFEGCRSLESLDISLFTTVKVQNMNSLFKDCSSLKTIDITSFNVSSVTNANEMFSGCSSLKTIYSNDDWNSMNAQLLVHSSNMFSGCTQLVGGEGSVYTSGWVTSAYARPDEGAIRVGYFTTTDPKLVYTEYKEGTLTYYYDFKYKTRTGKVEYYEPAVHPHKDRFAEYASSVNKAVIDASMQNAPLTSGINMFYGNVSDNRLINMTAIEGMDNLNTSLMTDMSYMFYGCNRLESLDLSGFRTDKVTSMEEMFYNCFKLQSPDLSSFNTEKVTTMRMMFGNCQEMSTLDVSSFNTSNVYDASGMFVNCYALTTIYCEDDWTKSGKMNTSTNMFKGCSLLSAGEGTVYDSDQVDRSYARRDKGIGQPGYFTTRKPQIYTVFDAGTGTLTYYYDELRYTREGETSGYPLPKRYLPYNEQIVKAVIDPSMKYAPLMDTYQMFYGGYYNGKGHPFSHLKRIEGMSNLNTTWVTAMNGMFMDCKSLEFVDLRWLKTSRVYDMSNMFHSCESLTEVNLSSFDIKNLEDATAMFAYCKNLRTIYCNDDWSQSDKLEDIETNEMFYGCENLTGGNGTTFSEDNRHSSYARPDEGPSSERPGYFTLVGEEVYTVFDEPTGTLTYYYDALWQGRPEGSFEIYDPVHKPDELRFSGFSDKVVKVVIAPSMQAAPLTSTYRMFYGGYTTDEYEYRRLDHLQEIEGMEYLNTENVTTMESMFDMCHALSFIDLSHINTDNVTNMQAMFADCYALEAVDLSKFNTENVTNMSYMFLFCKSLETLDLTRFNTDNVTNMRSMFNRCEALTTIYCEDDWSLHIDSEASTDMFKNCTSLVGGYGTVYDEDIVDRSFARPDRKGQAGYFTGYTQGMESVESGKWKAESKKMLRDGELIIERDGAEFTILGERRK